jgi:hypothetical protein
MTSNLNGNYVAILGDPACRKGWEANFLRLTDRLWETFQPMHVFVAGDVVMNGTAAEHEVFKSICSRYPWKWHVAMGDHDRPLSIFQEYWGAPHGLTEFQGWRFIGVDTSLKFFTEEEAQWLGGQIKDNVVIYMHMPPGIENWSFHAMSADCTARFLSVLDKFTEMIQACFFGHIHTYDRKEYRGIPLIVTGGSGPESRFIGSKGYEGRRPSQAMVLNTVSGEILLFEDDI